MLLMLTLFVVMATVLTLICCYGDYPICDARWLGRWYFVTKFLTSQDFPSHVSLRSRKHGTASHTPPLSGTALSPPQVVGRASWAPPMGGYTPPGHPSVDRDM